MSNTPSSSSPNQSSTPTIYHSDIIKDRKSLFTGHATRVISKQEALSFHKKIKSSDRGATHNILAYRIVNTDGSVLEDCDDDGEQFAGNKLLTFIRNLDVKNAAVVVSRWFGGILLGPVRFEHITTSAKNALEKGGLIDDRNIAGNERELGKRVASSNAIVVNGCQRGNPLLQYIRNIPWEYGEIVPDYVLGTTTCALFLSLRYHRLHPEYVYTRIQKLAHQFQLRILLVLVDIDNHQEDIRELTKTCITNNFAMMLAWSQEEAGRYLETYKAFEHKPPDLIMERVENDYFAKLTHCLTQVRSVNKTDVVTLVSMFGSLKRVMAASEEEIAQCPGFGEYKVKRLTEVFNQPFLSHKSKRKKDSNNK